MAVALLWEPSSALLVRSKPSGPFAGPRRTAALKDAAAERHQDSRWWKPFATDEETQTSSSVDEYLRFLERRYTRLYEDEPEVTKTFNVLEWLKQGEAQQTELKQNHDAFYALGVAGVAGKQLLEEKSNLVIASRKEADLAGSRSQMAVDVKVSAVNSAEEESQQCKTTLLSSLAAASYVSPTIRRLLDQRRLFLQMQTRRVRTVLALVFKTTMNAPKTITKKLWNISGGKKNVMATASLVVAFTFFVLKPIVEVIVNEGL